MFLHCGHSVSSQVSQSLADFFLQITVFVVALSMDGKRIQDSRADVFFCYKVENKKPPRKEWVTTLFKKFYVPFLFHPITQISVAVMAVFLTIISGMSCAKLTLGLN